MKNTKQKNIEFERKTFTVDDLTVGILADSQLPPLALRSKPSDYEQNLTDALVSFQKHGVNFVWFAGDICNLATKRAYAAFRRSFENAYGARQPILRCIMGNHDYWGQFKSPAGMRKFFRRNLGLSPYSHVTVNGYHFIGVSPYCGNPPNAYRRIVTAARREIESAIAEHPDRPVFVMTHNAAVGTLYTANTECDQAIGEIFKGYGQVVNVSGHTHTSVLDPRSVHQEEFTSIGAGSVAYTELDSGKINAPIPDDATKFPKGTILKIDRSAVTVLRVDLKTGTEATDRRVVLPLPLEKKNFRYRNNVPPDPPSFPIVAGRAVYAKHATTLCFPRAVSDDVVVSYRLIWDDGTEQNYHSDFYLGNSVSEKEETAIGIYGKKRGVDSVNVYAVDSFGTVSRDFCRIENVKISGFYRFFARWKDFGAYSILRLF